MGGALGAPYWAGLYVILPAPTEDWSRPAQEPEMAAGSLARPIVPAQLSSTGLREPEDGGAMIWRARIGTHRLRNHEVHVIEERPSRFRVLLGLRYQRL
jgi:hypothetical protein